MMKLVIWGFSSLGMLVGNLIGLSTDSLSSVLLPALLTLVGAGGFGFLSKLAESERAIAMTSAASFCIACLVGIYSSVWLTEHRIFTPPNSYGTPIKERKVLRGDEIQRTCALFSRYDKGLLSSEQLVTRIKEHVCSP